MKISVWVVVEPTGFWRESWCELTKKAAIESYEAWISRQHFNVVPFKKLERLGYKCVKLSGEFDGI